LLLNTAIKVKGRIQQAVLGFGLRLVARALLLLLQSAHVIGEAELLARGRSARDADLFWCSLF